MRPKQNNSRGAPDRSGKPVYHTRKFSRQHMKWYAPNGDAVRLYHAAAGWETWEHIAKHYNVPVEALLSFNFPGSVSPEGRILPNVVNWFLFNSIRFRTPHTANGVKAKFRGGEKIAIPKTVAMPLAPTVVGASSQDSSGPVLWIGKVISGGKAAVVVEEPPVSELWSRVLKHDKGHILRYGVSQDRLSVFVTEVMDIPDLHIDPQTFTIRLKEMAPERPDAQFDAIIGQALTGGGERARPGLLKRTAGNLWNTLYMWVNSQCRHDHESLDQEYERQCEFEVQGPNAASAPRG